MKIYFTKNPFKMKKYDRVNLEAVELHCISPFLCLTESSSIFTELFVITIQGAA